MDLELEALLYVSKSIQTPQMLEALIMTEELFCTLPEQCDSDITALDGNLWNCGCGVLRRHTLNTTAAAFLTQAWPPSGAGGYRVLARQLYLLHALPAIASRLTTIFEFQTMICQLTGMDVANASMYDGSTAVPEAAMMAVRATGKGRVLVAKSVHPEYREVLRTYARNQGMPVDEFGYLSAPGTLDLEDLERKIDDLTGAVIVQSPNFFGIVDQVKAAAEIAHKRGALLVVIFTEAVSLGILEPPADADIVAGELQSFAISPSYGGPYAGIIATKEKFIRQMPGRLVGQTTDSRGNRAFCLTLSTREQHIRREKATSNICTNQALIALMATVFMTVYGKQGLRELAEQNLAKAHYLAGKAEAALHRPVLQRIRGARGRQIARRGQQSVAEKENHRRPAAGPLLSRTGRLHAALRHRNVAAARHGRGGDAPQPRLRQPRRCWHDHQSPPSSLAERSPAVRAQFARQEGLPASRARRARGGCRRSARRRERARRNRRLPRSQRSGGHPPLHAPLHLELRHRSRHVPAGLLHHEVQPAHQRTGGAHRRPGLGASLSARSAVAGLHGSDGARWKRRSPKSPAWTRSRCSPPPARTAN